jgi:hypothetical protein
MTGKAYFGRIKALADEMANAGQKLDEAQIISYILAGLDDQYDGFVAAITALIKAEKHVSLSDLYSQFLSCESRLEGRNPSNRSNTALDQITRSMLQRAMVVTVVALGIWEIAVVDEETTAMAVVIATRIMVASTSITKETMVAEILITKVVATTSSNIKVGKDAKVEALALFVRFVTKKGTLRSVVGNASTKASKVQGGRLVQP